MTRGLVLVALLAAGPACGRGGGGRPAADDHEPPAPVRKGSEMTSAMQVEAELVEVVQRRPPLAELRVDLTARNTGDQPRWVVVPQTLEAEPADQGGVSTLQVWRGTGPVTVARTLGQRAFQAVRLGPGAAVTVRGLTINWWRPDEEPATLTFDAVVARSVSVAGKPLETELGDDATATGTRTSADLVMRDERSWSDTMAEVPVEIDEESRTPIVLDLAGARVR